MRSGGLAHSIALPTATIVGIGLVVLLVLVFLANNVFLRNVGNLATMRAVIEGNDDSNIPIATDEYFVGLLAYSHGRYEDASRMFASTVQARGSTARRWHAQSLARSGANLPARHVLDLNQDAELYLYGELLVDDWEAAPLEEKRVFLEILKQRHPDWIPLTARMLLEDQRFDDAAAWAQEALRVKTSSLAFIIWGSSLFYQDHIGDAAAVFRQAYDFDYSSLAAYWYARSLAEGTQPARGVLLLEQLLVGLEPGDPLYPWLQLELGVGYARNGQCADAEVAFALAEELAALSTNANTSMSNVSAIRSDYLAACQEK